MIKIYSVKKSNGPGKTIQCKNFAAGPILINCISKFTAKIWYNVKWMLLVRYDFASTSIRRCSFGGLCLIMILTLNNSSSSNSLIHPTENVNLRLKFIILTSPWHS